MHFSRPCAVKLLPPTPRPLTLTSPLLFVTALARFLPRARVLPLRNLRRPSAPFLHLAALRSSILCVVIPLTLNVYLEHFPRTPLPPAAGPCAKFPLPLTHRRSVSGRRLLWDSTISRGRCQSFSLSLFFLVSSHALSPLSLSPSLLPSGTPHPFLSCPLHKSFSIPPGLCSTLKCKSCLFNNTHDSRRAGSVVRRVSPSA